MYHIVGKAIRYVGGRVGLLRSGVFLEGWPENVDFKNPRDMKIKDLRALCPLLNEGQIKFRRFEVTYLLLVLCISLL